MGVTVTHPFITYFILSHTPYVIQDLISFTLQIHSFACISAHWLLRTSRFGWANLVSTKTDFPCDVRKYSQKLG